MSENTNKDKIENLDSLIVKRSNFNIVNFIIHKEMKLFLYILLFLSLCSTILDVYYKKNSLPP